MTWQRAIETGIPRQGLGGGENWIEGRISEEDNKKDVFLSSARLPQDFWRCWSTGSSQILQPHIVILSFLFFSCIFNCLCCSSDKASGQIWWVSTPPESLLSRTVPEGSPSVINPLMRSSLINLCKTRNSWRGGDWVITKAHNRRWGGNVEDKRKPGNQIHCGEESTCLCSL